MTAAKVKTPHTAKLSTQTIGRARLAGAGIPPLRGGDIENFRGGRRLSSPPQFEQWPCIPTTQAGQKVHSYEQMYASPSIARMRPHFSHSDFIVKCMASYRAYYPTFGDCN